MVFSDSYDYIQMFTGISHLWFLLMLFTVFCIVHFSRVFWLCAPVGISLLAFVVLLAGLRTLSLMGFLPTWLCLYKAGEYLPFFYLGIVCARFNLTGWLRRNLRFNHGLALLALCVIPAAWLLMQAAVPPFSSRSFAMLVCGLSASAAILSVHAVLESSPSVHQGRLWDSLDRNGMGIYILHHIIIVGVEGIPVVGAWMNSHPWTAPLVVFAMVLPLSWGFSECIGRTRFSFLF